MGWDGLPIKVHENGNREETKSGGVNYSAMKAVMYKTNHKYVEHYKLEL